MRIKNLHGILIFGFLYSPLAFAATDPQELFLSHTNLKATENVLVQRILSTDTILLDNGKKIKLIGLKAPAVPRRPKIEYDKNGKPKESLILPENTFEEKAFAFAHNLLAGKHVRLEYDTQANDQDFVTLAYVYLIENQLMANTEILRFGFADLQIVPPNFKYEDQLRSAYHEARREKRGQHNE